MASVNPRQGSRLWTSDTGYLGPTSKSKVGLYVYTFSMHTDDCRRISLDSSKHVPNPQRVPSWYVRTLIIKEGVLIFRTASNYDDYRTTLDQLDARRLLDPLVLLDGGDGIPSTLLPLRLPSMKIDGLFARHDVQPLTPPQSSPEISPIGSERLSFSSGRTTPQSPAISTLSVPSSSSSNGPRSVDLTKVRPFLSHVDEVLIYS
jgi:hypothetical protein